MSRQEGRVVRPLSYLIAKAWPAIEDRLIPGLRQEIIHGELSPDKVWREARRRLRELRVTADLSQEDEELASSYWALAKAKRDNPGLDVKYLKPKQEEKEMGEKKDISQKEFSLSPPNSVIELTTRKRICGFGSVNKDSESHTVRFLSEEAAIRFTSELLAELTGVLDIDERENLYAVDMESLRNHMIKILEEKYGLKVRVCVNCKHYRGIGTSCYVPGGDPKVICLLMHPPKEEPSLETLSKGCSFWEPKEVSESKPKDGKRRDWPPLGPEAVAV